ncbi:MAG: DsrE family protein [Pseudomonadales bacterium]
MSTLETQPQKILINWRDGARNPEQATITLILAVTSSKTCETAVFVAAEASELVLKGAAEGIQIAGYEPLTDLLEAFLTNGGKLWLCPACVKAKGIDETALLDGVEVAGAPRTMAYLASGAQLLA